MLVFHSNKYQKIYVHLYTHAAIINRNKKRKILVLPRSKLKTPGEQIPVPTSPKTVTRPQSTPPFRMNQCGYRTVMYI